MNLIFMGTPRFAVPALKALIEAGHTIKAVYSQPPRPAGRGQKETPSPVHQLALAHNIPVFTPANLKSKEVQEQFAAHNANAAIVAAYGLLLPSPILNACRYGCINLHPSSLPRWRGAAPIQRTLMAGDTNSAMCIMQMDEGLDTGGILLHEDIHIPATMTAGELHNEMADLGARLLLEVLQKLPLPPVPQSNEGVTYAAKIRKEEARIDWKKPAVEINNLIRGMNPAPGAWCMYGNERIKILRAEVSAATGVPGIVIENNLTVACGEGALRLIEVQRAGKRPVSAEELQRGHLIPTNTILQ